MSLPNGTYTLTAGPLPPGFPNPAAVPNVTVASPNTTTQDISLVPVPNLAGGQATISDQPPYGNGNGYPEPGEQNIQLTKALVNTGATAATGITAQLSPASQLLLCALMFIGRVGPISLVLSVVRMERPTCYQYPEEDLVVG